ncbi:MAG: retroviral-like aspartic protease family protein [Lachnospiraceae bacterium]|nr:retroviral-like aspartic protease family protein [Lachnospiraceae bacterium]
MSKSIINRVPSPFTGGNSRLEYYTGISFDIKGEHIEDMIFKVDTGSSFTVISSNMPNIEQLDLIDIDPQFNVVVEDASGNTLNLQKLIVTNFQFTEDILFDKIEIYITNMMNRKAIIGMDLLSLFDFQYLKEPNQIKGTFWINNYEESLNKCRTHRENLGYYSPRSIMLLDEDNINHSLNLTQDCIDNSPLQNMNLGIKSKK